MSLLAKKDSKSIFDINMSPEEFSVLGKESKPLEKDIVESII